LRGNMFKCECGSEEFYAHTAETMAVKYDGDGEELDGGEIMDVERPAWNKAYHCIKCEKAYSELPPKNPEAEWIKSRERYYLTHSSCCPICDSENISAGSIDMGDDSAWQSVTCMECGAEWTDIYNLIGVDIDNYPTDRVPKGILEPEKVDPNKEFKK